MRWLGLVVVAGIMGACLEVSDQESAKQKFITFVQSSGFVDFHTSLLLKVHNPAITVRYGFVPECRGKYSDAQVTSDIEKVLRLWLQPLRDWSDRPVKPRFKRPAYGRYFQFCNRQCCQDKA